MEIPVLESLFNKAAALQVCNFIKKRLQHRCFPVIIAKFLRVPIFEFIKKNFIYKKNFICKEKSEVAVLKKYEN